MRGGEPAVDGDGLAVDVGGVVGGQEQAGVGDLVGHAVAGQRVELADLVLVAAGPRAVEDRLGHAGLDQAGRDGVDPHARAVELVGRGLGEADDARPWRRNRPGRRRPSGCRRRTRCR